MARRKHTWKRSTLGPVWKASLAVGSALVVLAFGVLALSQSPGQQPGPVVIEYHADRAVYPTLDELTATATDIITGAVSGVHSTYYAGTHPDHLLPFTVFQVDVRTTVKGDASGEILVRQFGEATQDHVVRVTDDPPLQLGEEFVLFLGRSEDPQESMPVPESYAIVGGPQGRFLVDQGDSADSPIVYSLDVVEEEATWLPIKIHARELPLFLEEVKASD